MVQSCLSLSHLKLGCEITLSRASLGVRNEVEASEIEDFTKDFDLAIRNEVKSNVTDPKQKRRRLKTHPLVLDLVSMHLIGFGLKKITHVCPCWTGTSSNHYRYNPVSASMHCFVSLTAIQPVFNHGFGACRAFVLDRRNAGGISTLHWKVFLESFSGLVDLSILVEGHLILPLSTGFLKNHGPSLRSLVLDHRTWAKPKWDEVAHAALEDWALIHDTIVAISTHCPELREVGLVMDFDYPANNYKVIL